MRKESFQGILLGIVIMCAVFAFITVAWAALSSTLTIGGTASISAQSWYVGFSDTSNAKISAASVTMNSSFCTATTGATCPDGTEIPYPTLTESTFGMSSGNPVSLGKFTTTSGTITYTWYIVNDGTFPALVNGVVGADSSGNVTMTCTSSVDAENGTQVLSDYCAKISGKLKFGNSDPYTITDIPAKSTNPGSLKVQLVLSIEDLSELSSLPTGNITAALNTNGITVTYSQAVTTTTA